MEMRGGQRVGVVGRTGAGKSSIAVALMRLVEPSQGRVLVDGVDLATLGLDRIRGAGICCVPQVRLATPYYSPSHAPFDLSL